MKKVSFSGNIKGDALFLVFSGYFVSLFIFKLTDFYWLIEGEAGLKPAGTCCSEVPGTPGFTLCNNLGELIRFFLY